MATHTRATSPNEVAAPAAEPLPGPLALLTGLNHVARTLAPFDPDATSLAQVAEGVRRILRPDGIAILLREPKGDYSFRIVDGVLSEWANFVLSGSAVSLLDTLLERDTVVLFHRRQKSPWTREFLFAAGMTWGALAPIRAHD